MVSHNMPFPWSFKDFTPDNNEINTTIFSALEVSKLRHQMAKSFALDNTARKHQACHLTKRNLKPQVTILATQTWIGVRTLVEALINHRCLRSQTYSVYHSRSYRQETLQLMQLCFHTEPHTENDFVVPKWLADVLPRRWWQINRNEIMQLYSVPNVRISVFVQSLKQLKAGVPCQHPLATVGLQGNYPNIEHC